MKHISLFSGIGGFDLAAQWMGWQNLAHCEINPFCQRILKYYWPNAQSHTDIRTTDFTIYRGLCDILTGGFPCQPYSTAGKRLGKEDDRHLWPEMLRVIREISPGYIVGENVRGLTNWNGGVVFDEVQADLEAEGFEVLPFLLPAASVNAPHRRDRIWFIAYAKGGVGNLSARSEDGQKETYIKGYGSKGVVTNPSSFRCNSIIYQTKELQWQEQPQREVGECHRKTPGNQWRDFPTQSPLRSGDDGLSSQLDGITFPRWCEESIKGAGNAIVPQVAYQIFQVINQMLCSSS